MTIKKLLSIMTLAVCASGCLDKVEYVDENSSAISGSTGTAVTGADAVAYTINQNILALHTLLTEAENGEFVTSSEEYTDSYGKGYRFILTTEDTVVLYGNTATPPTENAAPRIEAEKDAESGAYFWTLGGERLKDALGQDIRVSNPYISVRPIGTDWCYSVDGGVEWIPAGPIGAVENPYTLALVQRGAVSLGDMTFTPAWMPLFYYTMEEETSVAAGFSIKIAYTIDASETETPSVAVTDNGGWTVTATQPANGQGAVTITAPADATKGTNIKVTFTDGDYQAAQEIEVLLKAPNAWEAIVQAGSEYSVFRDLVAAYNTVDEEGNITGNTYLDMYDANGSKVWTMQTEDGVSTTLLLPTNSVIETAIAGAVETLKNALGREPNERDLKKFNDWILRACFYPEALTANQLSGNADCNGISGFTSTGRGVEAALWRPSAQALSGESKKLINGNAYYLSKLHIPAYIVIYRIKQIVSKAYKATNRNEYITVENAAITERTGKDSPKLDGIRKAGYTTQDGTSFPATIADLAVLYNKNNLTYTDDMQAALIIQSALLEETENVLHPISLPAGTYTLSIGSGGRSKEKFDISFKAANDSDYTLVKSDIANSSSYDFDGGGYEEYYMDYYKELSATGLSYIDNYNRDGTEIGTVTIKGEGLQTFEIKQHSKVVTNGSDKNGVCIYHWTLRPTTDVY